jgi:selenocysteine-specific elongation factor
VRFRQATRTFVIGTAGHVDHGKTSLVRALTGIDTDRLPEEKRRGISIELGFAPWRVAEDLRATIVDVPGHRRLVHAMIAGASGIELVLLVVAANEGVLDPGAGAGLRGAVHPVLGGLPEN